MTTFTAVRLDDADVSDPNSGFYPTQATTEQINSIPTESKGPGEVIYNITTGKLMLYNGTSWTTLNSSIGISGNIVINSYPTAPTDPIEGEIYYNTTTSTYQVYTDGAWQDIMTSNSEIVAQGHSSNPSPIEAGLIYYNTTNNTLRTQNNTTTSTIVTTPDADGHYVVTSQAYDQEPITPGIIYYDSAFNVLRTQNNTATNTVVTTPDPNGHYVVTSQPYDHGPITPGIIYYDSAFNVLRTQNNTATNTVVTTPDTNGNYVVKSQSTTHSPITPGIIYYDTTSNMLKTQNNTTTSTIVITPDANGNYVVKSNATDPSSPASGEIYYNTTEYVFKAYSGTAWGYLYPKPYYSYGISGNADVTHMAATVGDQTVLNMSFDPTSNTFFNTQTQSDIPSVGETNTTYKWTYIGVSSAMFNVNIIVKGYKGNNANDSTIDLKIKKNGDAKTDTDFGGAVGSMILTDNGSVSSSSLSFLINLSTNDYLTIWVNDATGGDHSETFTLTDFFISFVVI